MKRKKRKKWEEGKRKDENKEKNNKKERKRRIPDQRSKDNKINRGILDAYNVTIIPGVKRIGGKQLMKCVIF